jgi:hypothetical protein
MWGSQSWLQAAFLGGFFTDLRPLANLHGD